jgi:immunoglobulin-binding protein 1
MSTREPNNAYQPLMTLPLHILFSRALSSASQAFSLPTVDQTTQVFDSHSLNPSSLTSNQDLIQSSLTDLRDLESRINVLHLFSSNETLDDIGTHNLIYLLIPFVTAEVEGRVRTFDGEMRMRVLEDSQVTVHITEKNET